MEKGSIRRCDVKAVTAEYYYALMGLLDEHLLLENWNEGLAKQLAGVLNAGLPNRYNGLTYYYPGLHWNIQLEL